jgi:hypothetical protein
MSFLSIGVYRDIEGERKEGRKEDRGGGGIEGRRGA